MLTHKVSLHCLSVMCALALLLAPGRPAEAAVGPTVPQLASTRSASAPRAEKQPLGFALGAYDPAVPQAVDYSLVWNTFLDFSNVSDLGNAIAIDDSGNVLVTGVSHLTWGAPIRPFGGGVQDAYVAKYSPAGVLLWNTFLGGSGDDYGSGIAVDGLGNVLVIGASNAAWGAPVLPYKSLTDVFVAKLSPQGGLLWNTFLGSSSLNSNNELDTGSGIAVDSSGSVFVTGSSSGTWGSPVRPFSPDPNGFIATDAFVARLSSSGALIWNTFLGAAGNALLLTDSGNDAGSALVVDSSDNVFVAGTSASTWGSPVRALTPGTSSDGYAVLATMDVFVAKLNLNGGLTWNTFLGSPADEINPAIALNGSSVDVVGTGNAAWGSPLRAYSAKSDAFVAQLNANGSLAWNTFLGTANFDQGKGVAVDGGGNVLVTGASDTTWGAPLRAHTIYGSFNAFVARLNSSGALQVNTFLGDDVAAYGDSIAWDSTGFMYVAGWSDSNGAPWGPPLQGNGGNYVAKVDLSSFPIVVSSLRAGPNPTTAASVSFTVTFSRPVTAVVKADFVLTVTGGITGASITGVSGSGAVYTVTVNTGSGKGFLRLDLVDNDTILDPSSNPLGGPGSGNGSFTRGQSYSVRTVQQYLPLISK